MPKPVGARLQQPKSPKPKEYLYLEPAYSMDPEKIYRTRYNAAMLQAHGLEKFAYKVIPYSLLRSFSLTFDPRTRFRLSPQRVSPPTRTRIKYRNNITASRKVIREKLVVRHDRHYGPLSGSPCGLASTYDLVDDYIPTPTDITYPLQDRRYAWQSDTSVLTRPIGTDYGELEQFKVSLNVPERKMSATDINYYTSYYAPCPYGNSYYTSTRSSISIGLPAVLPEDRMNALRFQVMDRLNQSISDNVERLLMRALPFNRRYSLFRNVFELRDLPRSILSLRSTIRDLSKSASLMPKSVQDRLFSARLSKHIPEEYVSFWFGWRQVYSDLLGLLRTPQRVSDEINRLIRRSGKDTTYRSHMKTFMYADTTPPTHFYYAPYQLGTFYNCGEFDLSYKSRNITKVDLRVVISAKFDFPTVGVPSFRNDLFARKLGFYPTISDVYNLVPWTWLVDWFTGLGNYVELMDTINTDPDLINYGFITAVGEGEFSTTMSSAVNDSSRYHYWNGSDTGTIYTKKWYHHTSTATYKAQVRKDLANSFGVKSILEPGSLSAYQNSILGGILLGRRRV